MRSAFLALAGLLAHASPALAEPGTVGWFSVPASVLYQTGDSWTNAGITYRLYGVQSCFRGTSFTNAHGAKRDCGEASLAMLAALIRDLQPHCYEAVRLPAAKTVFVVCVAQPTSGAGAGSRIDLGTALIASGFAFAALGSDGKSVHPAYAAAEQVAEQSRAGLWAFADLPNPNAVIRRAQTGSVSAPQSPDAPRFSPSNVIKPRGTEP